MNHEKKLAVNRYDARNFRIIDANSSRQKEVLMAIGQSEKTALSLLLRAFIAASLGTLDDVKKISFVSKKVVRMLRYIPQGTSYNPQRILASCEGFAMSSACEIL